MGVWYTNWNNPYVCVCDADLNIQTSANNFHSEIVNVGPSPFYALPPIL